MKWFKNTIALLFFSAGTLLAQTTISAVSEPEFPGRPDVMKVYSEAGYTAYRNAIGTIPLFVTRNATADSLEEQKWIVTVDRTSRFEQAGLHYQHIVIVEGTLVNDPSHRTILYKDTVDMSSATAELQVPDKDTRTTTTGNPFPFYRDSLFSVWLREDTLYSGDKTEIFFTRYIPVAADSSGNIVVKTNSVFPLATNRITKVDSATILTNDTLASVADTFFTTAFFGQYDYADLFAKVNIANSSTAAAYGVGKQYKVGDQWYAPMDSSRKRVQVVVDSATTMGDTMFYLRTANAVKADSTRFVVWGKTYYDSIWKWIKVYLSN